MSKSSKTSFIDKLPDQIKVGYKIYTINPISAKEAEESCVQGDCQHSEGIIRIRNDLPLIELQNTLLHETMHAIAYVYGMFMFKLKMDDIEEHTVNTMSNGLIGVFADSPELLEFLNLKS